MMVDIFDVNLISANWTPTGGGAGAAAVPEPTCLALAANALFGPVGGIYRSRKNRAQKKTAQVGQDLRGRVSPVEGQRVVSSRHVVDRK